MNVIYLPGKYRKEGIAWEKGDEERSVGAWRRVCWHGGHGDHRRRRGRPRRRCRREKPRACYRRRTGSSLALRLERDHQKWKKEEGRRNKKQGETVMMIKAASKAVVKLKNRYKGEMAEGGATYMGLPW